MANFQDKFWSMASAQRMGLLAGLQPIKQLICFQLQQRAALKYQFLHGRLYLWWWIKDKRYNNITSGLKEAQAWIIAPVP